MQKKASSHSIAAARIVICDWELGAIARFWIASPRNINERALGRIAMEGQTCAAMTGSWAILFGEGKPWEREALEIVFAMLPTGKPQGFGAALVDAQRLEERWAQSLSRTSAALERAHGNPRPLLQQARGSAASLPSMEAFDAEAGAWLLSVDERPSIEASSIIPDMEEAIRKGSL